MKVVDTGHIVIDPAVRSGEPHIEGHRIAVSDVAIWINDHHMSPEQIAEEFRLTLGEVYAALAYYYDHKAEVDTAIEQADQQAKERAKRQPKAWHLRDNGKNAN